LRFSCASCSRRGVGDARDGSLVGLKMHLRLSPEACRALEDSQAIRLGWMQIGEGSGKNPFAGSMGRFRPSPGISNCILRQVQHLSAPPRTLGLTEISRFSPNSPRMGGVCLARFCLCNGVLEPASRFELFVSAFKNPFPGNGDCGSKRPGSTPWAWGAFASRWLVPRLPRWRKVRPDAPLEVIGTDSVLDLNVGDADIAIRYARNSPTDGVVGELLKDTFWPICSPQLLASGLGKPADLRKHVLVHCYWSPSDFEAPTWQRWLAIARKRWPEMPELKEVDHLSFREELHAIEAVIAGQGIGLFSNVLVAPELKAGTLVKAFDVSLPFDATRRLAFCG
jgi:hypothetical protein